MGQGRERGYVREEGSKEGIGEERAGEEGYVGKRRWDRQREYVGEEGRGRG